MASNDPPFFSVIVPLYNRAHVIGDALRSVLAQTERDFEVLVIDDGSRDHPRPIIEALDDRRIRYIRRANAGGGAARNTGIDMARGRFIAFLDSDDEFLPHHLAAMRAQLEGTQLLIGYARVIVDRGEGRVFLKPPRPVRVGENMASYFFCDRGFVPTSTIVAPAEIAREIRFHEDLREAEDTDFAVRLSLAGYRFVMAEEPAAVWKDRYDPERLSAGRDMTRFTLWLESMKQRMPRKAYLAGRGWPVAKHVAATSNARALSLYLNALVHGCYGPSLAASVFLQIFLPDRSYRAVADSAIAWFRAGFRGRRQAC
jgi:glycosyltransferase involved in cell wall biosynthesis